MSGKHYIKAGRHAWAASGIEFSEQEYGAMKAEFGDRLPDELERIITPSFSQEAEDLGLTASEYAYSLLMEFGPEVERIQKHMPLLTPEERVHRMAEAHDNLSGFVEDDNYWDYRRILEETLKERNNHG